MNNILSNWKMSIGVLVLLSILYVLLMKKLVQTLQPQTVMFYVSFIIALGFMFLNVKNNTFKINIKEIILILIVSIIAIFINYITLSTIKILPNAGYIRLVNTLSLLVTVIICMFIFKDEFTIKRIIGILLCTSGGILMLIE